MTSDQTSTNRRPNSLGFATGSVDWYRAHFNRASLTANAFAAALAATNEPDPGAWNALVRGQAALRSLRSILDLCSTRPSTDASSNQSAMTPLERYADEVAG